MTERICLFSWTSLFLATQKQIIYVFRKMCFFFYLKRNFRKRVLSVSAQWGSPWSFPLLNRIFSNRNKQKSVCSFLTHTFLKNCTFIIQATNFYVHMPGVDMKHVVTWFMCAFTLFTLSSDSSSHADPSSTQAHITSSLFGILPTALESAL